MKRYVFTALAIGMMAAALVLALELVGIFSAPASWLGDLYTSRGLAAGSGEMTRLSWLEITMILAVSLGVAWCMVDVSQVGQKLLVCLLVSLVVIGLSPSLALHGWLFEPFSSLAAALAAAVAGFAFAGTERGMRKRVLQDVLGMRVSHETFGELLAAPEPPDYFAGAVREVTVMTCRVFNHEELREKLEPADLLEMSNLFLRSVSTFLTSRGAYLDESGPELVRVFFGMLRPTEDHAAQACRTALELRTRLRNLSRECETRWFQPLEYGIGISSGPMTVGVYGSPEHFFFSGIGGETDYSRRLAHANRRYGSDLLIGPSTYALVHESFEVRPMEMFYDPESEVMTEIYELLAQSSNFPDEDRARRDLFWQGVIYLREKRFEEALEHFSRARVPGAGDGPAEFFVARAQEGLSSAAGRSGDGGAEDLTEKGHARLISLM